MKFCSKCGKENNKDSKFCVDCGNGFENLQIEQKTETHKKSKTKIILIIVGIIILIFILLIITSVRLFIGGLGKGLDIIKDKIDNYQESEISREKLYDSIIEELLNKNLISKNLKYVDCDYGWTYEHVDKTDKYYVYIDSENYDKYKKYWLEGVDQSQYSDDYNAGLYAYGDYVFKAININDLSYELGTDYGNVHLEANKTYYLVKIYDEAIYYKYISAVDVNGIIRYDISNSLNYKEDSLSKKYIFYKENNEWQIKEIIE